MNTPTILSSFPKGVAQGFFLYYLVLFAADNIANYVATVPLFVGGSLLAMPVMLRILWKRSAMPLWIWAGMGWLICATLLNSLRGTFDVKNISDLLFVLLFVQAYFLYKSESRTLSFGQIRLFAVVSLLLYVLPLADVFRPTEAALPPQKPAEAPAKAAVDTAFAISEAFLERYLPLHEGHQREERQYLKGFFRIPHIAAYFFGFLSIFWAFIAKKNRSKLDIAAALALFALTVSTGVRAVPVALLLGVMFLFLHRKYLGYLAGLAVATLALWIGRNTVFDVLNGTLFEQHIQLLITAADHFSHLSRLMIWYSWWIGMSSFQWFEWIIGRSYASGLLLNEQHFGQPIWFHNDPLNMLYTYGLPGLAFYIGFMVFMYRNHRHAIRQNGAVFLYFVSMVILSIANGLYYYFPILLLYPFIYFERHIASDPESGFA
jgi:hypothetical protein